ncbi:hypothetical protein B0T24DRAFT_665221, partial [Lasiosphaeria ovina]
MFVGHDDNSALPMGWKPYEQQRFIGAIRALQEHHLVECASTAQGTMILTPRALQRSVLRQLDEDTPLRQQVFQAATQMVHNVFPAQGLKNRGDPSTWAASRISLTQVIRLNAAFTQCEPPIADDLHFAQLLSDTGNYLFNDGVQVEAVPILETAEAVCNRLLKTDPMRVTPILTDTLGILQIYNQFMGHPGRQRALQMTDRVLSICLDELQGTPPDTWSETDIIKVARSFVDRGCAHSQLNMMAEAGRDFDKALEYY